MERIKQAIEKARAEEDPKASQRLAPVSALRADMNRVRSQASSAMDVSLDYEYSRTKLEQPDPAHLEQHRIIAHHKDHPNSLTFDSLRTQVLQRMDENNWRVLAITSPSPGSGKTVVAINLAIGIAQQRQRTSLLVDFDLRRPSVARYLGLTAKVSLNDVLERGADVADAMVNPGFERLVVLPTLKPMNRPSELLASPLVAALLADLRARYTERVVVVDLPPALAVDDALAVLPQVDCVLLVVGSGTSSEKEIEEAQRRLSKVPLIGVVLNKDPSALSSVYY
jgi:protein-tyrosine kinase